MILNWYHLYTLGLKLTNILIIKVVVLLIIHLRIYVIVTTISLIQFRIQWNNLLALGNVSLSRLLLLLLLLLCLLLLCNYTINTISLQRNWFKNWILLILHKNLIVFLQILIQFSFKLNLAFFRIIRYFCL